MPVVPHRIRPPHPTPGRSWSCLLAILLLLAPAWAALTPQRAVDALAPGRNTIVLVEDLASGRLIATRNAALAQRVRLLPGSALKPFTASILLARHIISPRDRLLCRRVLPRYGARFACSHPRPTRPWNVVDALAWSCNSFFLTVAQRLPRQELLDGLRDFGLPPDMPAALTADTGAMAIGAAAVHATPWQLLAAYARLLRQGPAAPGIAPVLQGMRACVRRGTGTAAAVAGLDVAGKTGTIAEVPGGPTHAWFVGYAPARKPRWLVLVAVARGDAATTAAVIAGRIFAALQPPNVEAAVIPQSSIAAGHLLAVAETGPAAKPKSGADPLAPARIRRLATHPIRLELDTRHLIRSLRLTSSHPFTFTGAGAPITLRGPVRLLWTSTGLVLKTATGAHPWTGRALVAASAPFFDVAAGRQLMTPDGTLEVRRLAHRLQLIARMPLEEYVAGAVSAEAGDMPPAAERAMAVLVRTWALENLGRHHREGFDFCSTTHCEAFRMRRPLARAVAAARRTQGLVLQYHNRLATVFYSADCGGVTAPGSEFENGSRLPYLVSHPDPWCKWSPQTNWTTVIPKATLKALMVKAGWLPRSLSPLRLRVQRRDRSGRVLQLAATSGPTHLVRGATFRFLVDRHLGWNRIKSTLFKITDEGDALRFTGHGLGHGAGLCEDGAEGMARAGRSERQILAFYYPGTTIARLAAPQLKPAAVEALAFRPAAGRPAGAGLQPRPPRQRSSDESVRRLAPRFSPHLLEAAWIPAPAPPWRYASDGACRLRSQGDLPTALLPLCHRAVREAEARLQVPLLHPLTISVYASITGFIAATGRPGWVAAATRGNKIALPPLAIVQRHRGLAAVLRHEVYHVLIDEHRSPAASLCLQEGAVLYFTGEARQLGNIPPPRDPRRLSAILASPRSASEQEEALAACAARATRLARQHGEAALRRNLLAPRRGGE